MPPRTEPYATQVWGKRYCTVTTKEETEILNKCRNQLIPSIDTKVAL